MWHIITMRLLETWNRADVYERLKTVTKSEQCNRTVKETMYKYISGA